MPYDLTAFGLAEMTACSAFLRRVGGVADSMEDAAGRVVRHLYENLAGADGRPACPLVRLYKTHPFGSLPPDLQDFARGMLGRVEARPDLRCLTLLATAGDEPAWNDRARSQGHRAIPLASPRMVEQFPMIAQLVHQFGLEPGAVVSPDPGLMMDLEQRTYNVFYVEQAEGSPHIPAQEGFVRPYGIGSVVGFGGMLPSGELFAVILFSRERIPRETADLFKSLALSVKVSLLPFAGEPAFA